MRNIALFSVALMLAGCGGTSIENSGDAANDQVNAINANLSEGSGRDDDADALGSVPVQRSVMPQEPPRGR